MFLWTELMVITQMMPEIHCVEYNQESQAIAGSGRKEDT